MEYLDQVDGVDNVIGKTTKAAAHRLGKIHRVAAVLAFLNDGRLLVQKRSDDGKLDHSVGGHVAASESYIKAAKREAKEELCIERDLEFVGKIYADETFTGRNIKHMFGIFKCFLPKDWQFTPTDEVKAVIAMHISDIQSEMILSPEKFSAGFVFVLREYIRVTQAGIEPATSSLEGNCSIR